jgi:hypothetical protein
MNPRRKCAFCGNDAGKISGEHLISAWIGELLGEQNYTVRFIHPETGEIKTWPAKSLDVEINAVCKRCNETWMSRIEEGAKYAFSHIIRDGSPVSLLSRGIATLAAFAFKSAVVATYINRKQEPFFTRAERERFRSSLEIPPNVQMWLAGLPDISMTGTFIGHVFGIDVPRGTVWHGIEIDDFESYAFTYSAGHLVLQVLACRHGKISNRGKPLPVLQPNTGWNESVMQFWPNNGTPIRWPPALDLSSDALNGLANRWKNAITFT